ncbi:alpha-L-glutamate ligase-like protein [Tamilnaduibacter salinus]|uniref:Alpha-L-glutamate ligase-like protein n=1 Tax=Tamilnaduibacter salinus TaxID=1484056 RepID=A0A2U1D1L2_9GAMM|nr:alpha-L-glutamate ligase-like protein [Tamilnaduibacter salinus]PVY79198.1 alpha-L-glutamate ligase-like protein [Tamilnaduibacter salinus]
MKWISPFRLARLGMLSMNRRNVDYIARYNDRASYPLVDNKLRTKLLAADYGVATPGLKQVIRLQHDIPRFREQADQLGSLAIKPAKGSGGKGIVVITGRDGDRFLKGSGNAVDLAFLERHLSNILAGLYSLGGSPDVAIVEDLIECSPQLNEQSFEGVPDIRIVVFQGYPVMAMLRLASHASDGKANLHQGAIGVGLDIGTGSALHAVQFNRTVHTHPDTGLPLNRLSIPDWRTLLLMASRCYDATGLGYMGADMVIDATDGPMLLELNARPGLAIQMANGQGLLPRLRHIEALRRPHLTAEERVDYAMGRFGAPLMSPANPEPEPVSSP